jgi:hypothetical protein
MCHMVLQNRIGIQIFNKKAYLPPHVRAICSAIEHLQCSPCTESYVDFATVTAV